MSTKTAIWIGVFIGSTIGGYIPVLFGLSILSFWSFFWGTVGSFIGVWAGYQLAKNYF